MNNVKIAYLLLVHSNVEQINLFVNQLLNYGECDIYIHVDKKNEKLLDKITKADRIKCVSIYEVNWGSSEIVKATIELMKLARNSNNTYSHIYFGSGQDLLIKKGLYEYLRNNPDNIFIKIENKVESSDFGAARFMICWPRWTMVRGNSSIKRYIRQCLFVLFKFGIKIFPNKKKLAREVVFYRGRTWFIAPWKILDYILNYLEQNPDYLEFWEDSLAPDLMFFQTLIMNSPYSSDVLDELMYVKFGETFKTKNHPLLITLDMIKEIENENYYCARKFDLSKDKEVYMKILSQI